MIVRLDALIEIVTCRLKKGMAAVLIAHVNFFISFDPLPNDKILHWTKLKAFADDKLNFAKMRMFLLGRIENIEGKGENAGYQHFILFPQCFQKQSFTGSLKVWTVW